MIKSLGQDTWHWASIPVSLPVFHSQSLFGRDMEALDLTHYSWYSVHLNHQIVSSWVQLIHPWLKRAAVSSSGEYTNSLYTQKFEKPCHLLVCGCGCASSGRRSCWTLCHSRDTDTDAHLEDRESTSGHQTTSFTCETDTGTNRLKPPTLPKQEDMHRTWPVWRQTSTVR